MRFEGAVFKPSGNEPAEMGPFFNHYSFVNRFLQEFNNTKLSTSDNVANFAGDVSLVHGVDTTITHNLRYTPKIVQANGRVEFIIIRSKSPTKVVVKPRLLTVAILNPLYNRPQERIAVSDVSFFSASDSVNVGGVVKKLKGISGNSLILDGNVIYNETVNTISLAVEIANVFII